MRRKPNFLIIGIIAIALAIASLTFVYEIYIRPSASIYATYIETYNDVISTDIDAVRIESINHKVVIKTSTDDKFHISYFQKADNSNVYGISKRVLTLKIIEPAENLDNLFYKSKRAIDTITISIPDGVRVSINNTTVSGSLDIIQVAAGAISASSINGSIDIQGGSTTAVQLSSNTGSIMVQDTQFSDLQVDCVAGSIEVSLTDSLADHRIDVDTTYGSLFINGEQHKDADGNIQSLYVAGDESAVRVRIRSTRSRIGLDSIEKKDDTKTGQ